MESSLSLPAVFTKKQKHLLLLSESGSAVIRMSAHMYQRCFRLAAVIHGTDQFVQITPNIHPPAMVLSVPCPILTAQHLATSAHSSELIHHVLCLYYSISFHGLQVLFCAIIPSAERMNTWKTAFT